jgi:CspA family cold shock protein
MPKTQGTVKWFDRRKRYGFISVGDSGEVFFHQEQLLATGGGTPKEGQIVRFHVRQAAKGPQAINVEVMDA